MKYATPKNPRYILIDFEFRPINSIEGNDIEVLCLVAYDLGSGEYTRIWSDDLLKLKVSPFKDIEEATLVAYYASAEMKCFLKLGWQLPDYILDLYSEFRNLTNGLTLPYGRSLLGAMKYFSLHAIEDGLKTQMRELALRGGPYSEAEQNALLDYCQSDVDALASLLRELAPTIDLPRALLRGRYSIPLAQMESNGVPIDLVSYRTLCRNWDAIKSDLILEIDREFHVYQDGVFKEALFEEYLIKHQIRWPRLQSGRLCLDDETFRDMSKTYPELKKLRNLRESLSKLRLNALQVGSDGRNRCILSAYGSKTGRNQPSTNRFIFGNSKWLRGLIQPKEGMALAYVDWSQQEFGIAAALSGDENMKAAYLSGDPYLAFAKQAGAVPATATRHTHSQEREQYKQCVLATQYGMGVDALAVRIKQPKLRAKQLLDTHRRVYWRFWEWSDNLLNFALSSNVLTTLYGWTLHLQAEVNPRSLRNFPMQANAAELLRIACILMFENGLTLCAPVHDAILIEARDDQIEAHAKIAQSCMRIASKKLLDGFTLSSEVEIYRFPERFLDANAREFWEQIQTINSRYESNTNV